MDNNFAERFAELLDGKQFAEAIALASQYADRLPRDAFYHECLGYAYWLNNDEQNAISALKKAFHIGELSCNGLIILLRSALHQGRRVEARKILADMLSRDQLTRRNLESLASRLGQMCEYASALQVCRYLSRKFSDSADAWYGIGFYQERMGCDASIVVGAFGKAVKLSGCVCSRVHLAKVLAQMGCWEEAYGFVKSIPTSFLNRVCWVVWVYQIAIANEDYAMADSIRATWSQVLLPSLE